MSRAIRWSLWVVGFLLFVVLLGLLGVLQVGIGCGRVPIVVRGTVVDATTGAPVQDAAVLTLLDPEVVEDPERLGRRREMAQMYAEATEEEQVDFAPICGTAHTDARGAFRIIASLGVSTSYGPLGIELHHERSNPFDVARALLVERDGYVRLVHDTSNATWQEYEEGELAGTFDVGMIRLVPAAGR